MFPIYYLYHSTNFHNPNVHYLSICKQKLLFPLLILKGWIFSVFSKVSQPSCIRNQEPVLLVNYWVFFFLCFSFFFFFVCHTACSELKSQWKSWEKNDLYSRTWTILIINASNKASNNKSMTFPFPEIKSIRNAKFYLKTPKDLKVKRFIFSVKYKSFSFTCRDCSSL